MLRAATASRPCCNGPRHQELATQGHGGPSPTRANQHKTPRKVQACTEEPPLAAPSLSQPGRLGKQYQQCPTWRGQPQCHWARAIRAPKIVTKLWGKTLSCGPRHRTNRSSAGTGSSHACTYPSSTRNIRPASCACPGTELGPALLSASWLGFAPQRQALAPAWDAGTSGDGKNLPGQWRTEHHPATRCRGAPA